VTGAHGPDAHEIDAALVTAGKRMTTLDVNRHALLAAVAPFHLVRSLSVSTSFPHGLRIRVIERLAVATLNVSGAQTAVAADGTVLGRALVSPGLPTVTGAYEPPAGGAVHDASLVAELEVLGAVPRPLAPFLARAFDGPRGLTVAMRDGLEAYFGDASRAHAKWLALAVVLSDSSSAHASAVDVRAPERPAAQFPSGYAPSTAAGSSAEAGASSAASSSESLATALAAGLAASAGYGSSAEAQSANAAKAAEALSPSHATSASESGSSAGSSTPGQESQVRGGSEAASTGGGGSSGAASAGPGGGTSGGASGPSSGG
jgi:cell division septal protein FtsQ